MDRDREREETLQRHKDWIPDSAIEELTLRRALQGVEDPVRLAAELLKEALPLATMSMTHLAIHSPNEVVRMSASKYVLDRSMGPVSANTRPADERPAWDKIFDSVLVEVDRDGH